MRGDVTDAGDMPVARPHFIAQDGHDLFAWHHPARPAARRGAAIVLCPSIGGEYVRIYRLWRMLAERLAGAGFDVIRFDYEGTGDSAGDIDEPERVPAWLRNIDRVATEARSLTGASEIALVGLRIGGMLALHSAAASGGVDRLVLWSPFRSGRAYVRELKALARLSNDDFAAVNGDGQDILAAGYRLPAPVAAALERLDVDSLTTAPARRVLVVDRDDRAVDPTLADHLERLGCGVTRVRPAGTGQLFGFVGLPEVPDALDAITTWFDDWPARGRRVRTVDPEAATSESMSGERYCERAVRFGPSDRLLGVVTLPTHAQVGAPAIVFLNTNYEYRIGPQRLYAPLAREYAARGHVVLRYDLGGVGDSEPPAGAAHNIAYPAHALDDAREAIAFLRKEAPGRRIIVVGLCSGAWHAFRAAREGLPVDAIVSVNPPLYLRDGPATTKALCHEIGGYRRALRDPARWRAGIRRGLSAYLGFIRFGSAYAHGKLTAGLRAIGSGRLEGLAGDLDDMSARGVTSLFVFSSGDGGLEYFRLYGSPALRRRRVREHVRHVVVDGAGHTFTPPEAQHALRACLLDFIIRQTTRSSGGRTSGD